MATQVAVRKPISVRATEEQHRLLTRAAAEQHRTLNGFVLNAALEAARVAPPRDASSRPRRSLEEIEAIVKAAQEEFKAANTDGRDPLAELIAERRAEAARE